MQEIWKSNARAKHESIAVWIIRRMRDFDRCQVFLNFTVPDLLKLRMIDEGSKLTDARRLALTSMTFQNSANVEVVVNAVLAIDQNARST